jgi:mannose-6-phosphate isomerase-like protein (cupin superfamily)
MDKIKKIWGFEHWFANNDKYCGKLLYVEKGKWSSKGAFHYHKDKDETFFIIDGMLRLDYVTDDGEFKSAILKNNESFRVKQLMKHRFTALSGQGCKFIEASTTHRDDDSYRVNWDEDKKQWVDVK